MTKKKKTVKVKVIHDLSQWQPNKTINMKMLETGKNCTCGLPLLFDLENAMIPYCPECDKGRSC